MDGFFSPHNLDGFPPLKFTVISNFLKQLPSPAMDQLSDTDADTDMEGSPTASVSQEEDYEQPVGYYNKYLNLDDEVIIPPPAPSPLSYTLSDFSDSSEDESDRLSVSSEESLYDTSDSEESWHTSDSDPPVSSSVRPMHVPDGEHGKRDEQTQMEECDLKRQTKREKQQIETADLRDQRIQKLLQREATLKQKFLKWLPKVKPRERTKFKYNPKPPGRISNFIDKFLRMKRLGEGRTKKKKKQKKKQKKEGNEEEKKKKKEEEKKEEEEKGYMFANSEDEDSEYEEYVKELEEEEEEEEDKDEEEVKKPGFLAKLFGKKKNKKDKYDQDHLEEETAVSEIFEEEKYETTLAIKSTQKKPGFLSKLFGKTKKKRKGYQE